MGFFPEFPYFRERSVYHNPGEEIVWCIGTEPGFVILNCLHKDTIEHKLHVYFLRVHRHIP